MCSRRWLGVASSRYGRCMTVGGRRRHQRTGLAVAAAAFMVAMGASVTSALALAHPVEPARDTVRVVPPGPVIYSVTDTQAAKDTTCDAWDQASTSNCFGRKAARIAGGHNGWFECRNRRSARGREAHNGRADNVPKNQGRACDTGRSAGIGCRLDRNPDRQHAWSKRAGLERNQRRDQPRKRAG